MRRLLGKETNAAPPAFEPDFHAVSYPKTGNVWTQVMLGRYVQRIFDLTNMPLFDQVEMTELRAAGYTGPTGLFTHHPLTWETQSADNLNVENVIAPFRGKRIILLTRHPLDTLVSAFMHVKFMLVDSPYPGSLADFIEDPVYGLEKLIRFHEIWAAHHAETAAFLLWRYEDVRADPALEMRRLLDFLSLPHDADALADAVNYASFENLRAMEASGARLIYKSSGFNIFGSGPRDDPNAFHIRKGRVNGYKDELDPALSARLENIVRDRMPKMFLAERM